MKSKLCFAASALALIVGLVSMELFMEMYDVKLQMWGLKAWGLKSGTGS